MTRRMRQLHVGCCILASLIEPTDVVDFAPVEIIGQLLRAEWANVVLFSCQFLSDVIGKLLSTLHEER